MIQVNTSRLMDTVTIECVVKQTCGGVTDGRVDEVGRHSATLTIQPMPSKKHSQYYYGVIQCGINNSTCDFVSSIHQKLCNVALTKHCYIGVSYNYSLGTHQFSEGLYYRHCQMVKSFWLYEVIVYHFYWKFIRGMPSSISSHQICIL